MDKITTCSFTGHRPNKLPFPICDTNTRYLKFKEHLEQVIIEVIQLGAKTFYTGMALGTDMIAADIILKLKSTTYPHLNLRAAIPFLEQTAGWNEQDKLAYNKILDQCGPENIDLLSKETMPDKKQINACLKNRNAMLVMKADILIAVYSSKYVRSGTGQTVRMAQKQGKEVIIVNPELF